MTVTDRYLTELRAHGAFEVARRRVIEVSQLTAVVGWCSRRVVPRRPVRCRIAECLVGGWTRGLYSDRWAIDVLDDRLPFTLAWVEGPAFSPAGAIVAPLSWRAVA